MNRPIPMTHMLLGKRPGHGPYINMETTTIMSPIAIHLGNQISKLELPVCRLFIAGVNFVKRNDVIINTIFLMLNIRLFMPIETLSCFNLNYNNGSINKIDIIDILWQSAY